MQRTVELVERVRALRAAGGTPKEIARAVGARPAEITAIVRDLARDAAAGEPAVAGCWVSHGWSTGLTISGDRRWADEKPADGSTEGLVCVMVARRGRPQRLSVCGYLLDTFCLGVKNALGPRQMNERDLPSFQDLFFGDIEAGRPPLDIPLDLARHLVFGSVDYARTLGFEPHPDFAAAAGQLGEWAERSAITFGRDGTPLYVSGPNDNPRAVLRTLQQSVGAGNFHYVTHLDR